VDYVEAKGRELFDKACELDLEGIVAKRKTSRYRSTEKPSPYWIKTKNACYSRAEGRAEMFDELSRRHALGNESVQAAVKDLSGWPEAITTSSGPGQAEMKGRPFRPGDEFRG
jgi:hypothetical protein